jgi:hypothetical protein
MKHAWIVIALLLQSAPAPIRVGDLAKKLTAQEVVELEEIAAAGGSKTSPWLLEGPFGQLSNTIRVYLPPSTQTSKLRRGPAFELIRRQGQTAWTPLQTVEYVQLLKPGQAVNSIDGEQWPFVVSGSFSDEDVIEIVALVRRSEGGARLLSLGHSRDGSVTLTLTAPQGRTRLVYLQRQGSSWKVLKSQVGMP